MTPDFALSLSFEGIRLLHRGPEGWTPLGEVPLDSPDLTGDLAALRRAGEELGVPWRGTKILLPDEQIKTLVLDGPDTGPDAARRALDGATPYPVDDLVIDHVTEGGRTHVAAVARETLEEAEAFAAGHGFRPVSFAALPATGYPGEAFFGPTSMAGSYLGEEPVLREALSDGATDDDWTEGAVAEDSVAEVSVAEVHAATEADQSLAFEEPERVGAAGPEDAAPGEDAEAASADDDAAPATAMPSQADGEVAPPMSATTNAVAPSEDGDGPAPLDSDRTVAGEPATAIDMEVDRIDPEPEGDAGPLPPDADTADPPPPASPMPRAGTPLSATGVPQPVFASRSRALGGHTRETAAPPAPRQSRDKGRAEPILGRPAAAAGASGLAAPTDVPRAAPPAQRPMPPGRREPAFGPRPAEAAPAASPPATPPKPRRQAAAKAPAKPSGRPRHLGLVLTVVLLVLMAAVAVWAAASEQGLAGLFGRGEDPATQVAAAPPAQAPTEPAPEPEQVAAAPAPDVEAAAAAVARAIEALPQEEPAAPAVAPDVWAGGPPALPIPDATTLDEAVLPPANVAALSRHIPPVLAAMSPDAPPVAAAPSPPQAEEGAAVRLVAGPPPLVPPTRSDDGEPGWVNAMADPPATAPRLRPDGLAPPAATAEATPLGPDDPPLATAAPTGADALIAALAPGAAPLTEGPPLPSALAFAPVAPDTPTPGGVSLAGLRPSPRPEGAEPPVELASYEGPRPGPRPDGLAPEEAPAEDVSDAVAEALETPETPESPAAPNLESTLATIMANAPDPLAGATARAVPVARRPDTRPANFGRVVATQLDRLARASAPRTAAAAPSGNLQPNERAESEPEAASSAAAAPSGTTAASVATAATVRDAIAMREMNLIGVYGQPGARRALIRMGNGQYVRVSVGDRLDGGQVTAIGDNALNYVKRGRTEVLVIPGG